MRPVVKIATEGLEKTLKEHLLGVLEDGPIFEKELMNVTLTFFAPTKDGMTASLIRGYKLQYGKKLGKNTAEKNLTNNLRLLLSKLKKGILHTQKPIILGKNRIGRVFYKHGHEGQIQEKVKSIISQDGGKQSKLLIQISKGPVKVTPVNKRVFELFVHYGLCEMQKISGEKYMTSVGYNPVEIVSKTYIGEFPEHFKIYKPFKIDTWVLQDGPKKISLRFDLAGWDPVHKLFYVATKKDYVGLSDLKNLREKAITLGLPVKISVFCDSISESAKKYASKWGLEINI
ncbi:MAG: hypothetical protein GOU98_00980 [Candidatus Altiarchaeota archaeon]|nr:hypothetical protein [Candidatus Altiarchaeota archaeon]